MYCRIRRENFIDIRKSFKYQRGFMNSNSMEYILTQTLVCEVS